MPTIAPPQYVEVPTDVQPYRYGLFSVVEPVTPANARWQAGGITWESLTCELPRIAPEACPPSQVKDFTPTDPGPAEALPFTVFAPYSCAIVGRNVAEAKRRAGAQIERGEQQAVEQYIADTVFTAAVDQTTATNSRHAVGVMERYLANNGGGVLWIPRTHVPMLAEYLHTDDGRLLTLLDTPVIATVADLPFDAVYATPTPVLLRAELVLYPDDDAVYELDVNSLHALAERTYAAGFDSCTQIARHDINTECCGDSQ